MHEQLNDLLVRWNRWGQSPARSVDTAMGDFDAIVTSLGAPRRIALAFRARNLVAGVQVWSTLRVRAEAMQEAMDALAALLGEEGVELLGEAPDVLSDDMTVRSEYAAGEQPVQVIVTAGDRPAPTTTAPSSIWALAASFEGAAQVNHRTEPPGPAALLVQRIEGVTRCVGQAYPHREMLTEEMEECERQRRARQTPPRPTAGYKTKSRKFRKLIGEDDE